MQKPALSQQEARSTLDRLSPACHLALQKLVPAMADVVNHAGKKSLFGRDKGIDAQLAFVRSLLLCVRAMLIDNLISKQTNGSEILGQLTILVGLFRTAYPNWQEAYIYFEWMRVENRLITIDRLEIARDGA